MKKVERHMAKLACYMLVFVDGKILLMKRQNSGCDDGMYGLPSGHIEEGEDPLEGAVRETLEEIGILVTEMEFLSVIYRTNKNIGQKCSKKDFVDFSFVCKSFNGTPRIMEPEKCSEIILADVYNLPENVVPQVRVAIENIDSGHNFMIMER